MRLKPMLIAVAVVSTLAPAKQPSYTGTWAWGSIKGGGGTLKVIDLGGLLRFDLECYRGAPSHNIGNISGDVIIENGVGTFKPDDPSVSCEIKFTLKKTIIVLERLGNGDCDFGYAVFPDGQYRRKSSKRPKLEDPSA